MAESREDAGAVSPVTAYIVCGAESSGNRLVASILCRSGCDGEGSTRQPQSLEQLPTTAERPYVCILHYHLSPWVRAFRASGFARVVAILPIREPMANVRSMMVRGHRTEFEDGYRYRTVTIARNIVEALAQDVQLEIITYEGLTEPFLAGWLPRIGLPYVPGNLSLPGQHTSNEICNQNAKHYS